MKAEAYSSLSMRNKIELDLDVVEIGSLDVVDIHIPLRDPSQILLTLIQLRDQVVNIVDIHNVQTS